MADEILWCLDKASTKTGDGKVAVSKEAQALLRQMMPKPTASMSNSSKPIEANLDKTKSVGNSKIPEKIVEIGCKIGVGTTNLIGEMSGVKEAFDKDNIKKLLKKDKVKKALKEVGLDLLDDKFKAGILDQGVDKALEELINGSRLSDGDKALMHKLLRIILETKGADFTTIWKNGGTVCDYVSEEDFNRDLAPLLENSEGVRKFVDALRIIIKG